jgi:NAD(P)-dependent dehydrogenase (short-subunit alcohol dehydrogenase family)
MSETGGNGARCALVTGASRGLGAEIARALAADGWRVGINYRSNEDAARAVLEEINGNGGEAILAAGDVRDPDAADQVLDAVEERFGSRVLALVNNAGITQDGLSPQMTDE